MTQEQRERLARIEEELVEIQHELEETDKKAAKKLDTITGKLYNLICKVS